MDFISGIDRYSKTKPYGQGRFGYGLAQETVWMNIDYFATGGQG
ncbi:MAG: hypothetical protein RDU59_11155 [Thermodesulfobacteriota bacterium]|nr:hypothetical protein [Thermodesulfobacteriota bacterium]